MSPRYLFGPVTDQFAEQNLAAARGSGDCVTFGASGNPDVLIGAGDSWETVCARLPARWRPDFIALYLPYTAIPPWLWLAPVPLVGLAADWNLLFHYYRWRLLACDVVLTDTTGVDVLTRQGLCHVRAANLYGCERRFMEPPSEAAPRDIDLLFVANLQAAVERDRLPYLGRLARLADSYRVEIHDGVYGDDYVKLLRRARIVFNRAIRGECNRRALEATACGALLFQEAGNVETPAYFLDRLECVYYTDDNLEELLHYYLDHEDERRAIAEAGQARARGLTFDALWDKALGSVEGEWDRLMEAARKRQHDKEAGKPARQGLGEMLGRAWEVMGNAGQGGAALVADLAMAVSRQPGAAALHNALGMAVVSAGMGMQPPTALAVLAAQAVGYFRRAVEAEGEDVLAGLNLAEALAGAGNNEAAIEQARRTLAVLERLESDPGMGKTPGRPAWLDGGHFPPVFDVFRVEWERAGWENAGRAGDERRAKGRLIGWRLHLLLAELTGDLADAFEAVQARPDLAAGKLVLGKALARQGRHAQAAAHLRQAAAANPFDAEAARHWFQALGQAGDGLGQRRLARDRLLLSKAAPAVPAEAWFMQLPPPGDELASIIILCCNELEVTRLCLESVLRHTRGPYELVLVDNGSTDGTAGYLEEVRSWVRGGMGVGSNQVNPEPVVVVRPERVVVVRNETNLGFAAGVNQGLERAKGQYLVLLNNDTIVTPEWLERLIGLALHDWPHNGLVGPVTNCAADPQRIPVSYRSLDGIDAFAERRWQEFGGQALDAQRLSGFCLLIRREVIDKIGRLDEQFGLGFFDDDGLGVRAREAGFRLAVALGVFVHHFGSRTFRPPYQSPSAPAAQAAEQADVPVIIGEETAETPTPPAGASPEEREERPKVSLCAIVKDAEGHLAECLASVADLVQEMIVVDTGSADRTKEVAAEAGAKVFDFTWVDSFAAARNESLRHATGRWVLWLDADERLDEDNRARLRTLLDGLGDENVAFTMCQRSPLESGLHATVQLDQVRLFPNHPGLTWRYRVHEQILPDLRRFGTELRTTDIVIDHAGFSVPEVQGGKVDRNLRLLHLELAEHPGEPFVLYNLGAVALTAGQQAQALDYLRRSLAGMNPGDSLEHKVYVLLVRAHQELRQTDQALAACRAGRDFYPRDPELLFWEGLILRERGNLAGAETCFLQVLQPTPGGPRFASVDAGLQSYRARHVLAEVYRQQGRLPEAEAQWRAALAACPGFPAAWLNLAELLAEQGRWQELEEAAGHLEDDAATAMEGAVQRARARLGRRDFAGARQLLEEIIRRAPWEVWPRQILSHVLLQDGSDPAAAERALRDVLELDPNHAQARHNLNLFLEKQGRGTAAPHQPEAPARASLMLRADEGSPSLALRVGVGPALAGAAGSCAEAQPAVVIPAPGRNGQPRVSLCMIVKNEEANLPACLGSVADLVDEIVVADTGSTDATRQVAARFGAKVVEFPWVDDFAAARNEALRHATGCFIFWMDADDRLDEDNRARLRRLFGGLGAEDAAYVMKCVCLPDPVNGALTAVDHVRLFRNHPQLRWTYRVHEQILPALRRLSHVVRWTDVAIHHTGYQDPALRRHKLDRDLRLLRMEDAEKPDDPFTLFNLGQVAQELGDTVGAVGYYQRSLARSQPQDSIVRKLFALLAQCHRQLGQLDQALAACRAGRQHYPDDVELLFQEGLARREAGDVAAAEACLRAALTSKDGAHFASLDTGVAGYKARANLAVICQEQGRHGEAETEWRATLEENPTFLPARVGLAELYVAQGRWADLDQAAGALEALGGEGALEASLARARGHMARKQFATARGLLGQAIDRNPGQVRPRLLLSHALLQEGQDWGAAEKALRDVLAIDSGHGETLHNLMLLLEQRGKTAELAQLKEETLAGLYRAACTTPSDRSQAQA